MSITPITNHQSPITHWNHKISTWSDWRKPLINAAFELQGTSAEVEPTNNKELQEIRKLKIIIKNSKKPKNWKKSKIRENQRIRENLNYKKNPQNQDFREFEKKHVFKPSNVEINVQIVFVSGHRFVTCVNQWWKMGISRRSREFKRDSNFVELIRQFTD
jgi:hypothetical protein